MEVDNPNPVVTTLAKLELVNEIRTKTLRMLKMKEKLIETIESSKREDNYLKEYRCEMDLLLQEKMAHVEELRQIHSDINSMEAVIKQTEISRVNSLERVKKIYSEFAPIKNEVDRLRQSCLGLDRLPELHEEDPEFNLSDFMLEDKQKTIWQPQIKPAAALVENLIIPMANPAVKIHHHQSHHQHQPQKQTPPATSFVNMNAIRDRETQGTGSGKNVVERVNENQNQMMAPSFTRQAPPPMKSCLSCHQQIHRNAPICPLCKAKSRSRNPKKPKNKKDQH